MAREACDDTTVRMRGEYTKGSRRGIEREAVTMVDTMHKVGDSSTREEDTLYFSAGLATRDLVGLGVGELSR